MDRFLARLERRFGGFALPNTAAWVVGTWAVAFAMSLAKPELPIAMVFNPAAVMRGQVWRLLSGFFMPPPGWSLLFFIFAVSFQYFVLSSLEQHWGSFRLGLYLVFSWLLCLVAGFAFGMPILAAPMHMFLGVAFGLVFPDAQINLFLLVPIRAKWLALLEFGLILHSFVFWDRLAGPVVEPLRVSFAAAFVGFLVFFTGDLVRIARGQARVIRQHDERRRFAPDPVEARPTRACVQCGKTDDDDADLRVCTCQEFCGGKPTVYCLEHARSHNKH